MKSPSRCRRLDFAVVRYILLSIALATLAIAPVDSIAAAQEAVSFRPTVFVGDAQPFGSVTAFMHLGLSGSTPELLPGLTVEGELSLRVTPSTASHDPSIALTDNSSFLRLRWRPSAWPPNESLSLTLLPLHADRLYLGFEFPLADTLDIYGNSPDTGAELRIERERWYALVSVKSQGVENPQIHDSQRQYTVFAGGGADLLSAVRIEAEASRADESVNPEPQVLGTPVRNWGAAARVAFHRGLPIGPVSDYRLAQRDPAVWEKLMRPETYDDGLSFWIAGEALVINTEGLASPDSYGASEAVTPLGFAMDARLKWGRTRFYLRGQYRSLSLIQNDPPGFPPFYAFPIASDVRGEYDARAAIDHFFERARLTPGIELGVSRPAAFTSTRTLGGNNPPPGLPNSETVVVLDNNQFDIRPDAAPPDPTFFAKLTLRWDTEWLSAIGEAYYFRNPNRTTFAENVLGTSGPMFAPPSTLDFDVLVQARF